MAAPVINFTNAQLDAFFTNAPQMALTPDVRARLAWEGLQTIEDFHDFKEDQLDQAIRNLRTPIPGVPALLDDAGNIVNPAIPAINPCLVSARCKLRLKVASIAFHYYRSIGRSPTPQNMNYTLVLRAFYEEWEAILKLAEADRPKVPTLSKTLTPLKWIESFKDCLYRTYGVRSCPISYVIRETVDVPLEADNPLQAGHSYGESGSVLEEMISRMNHTDPLFRSDNALVYSLLDTAARGTHYSSNIKPYARTKNGRQAWLDIVQAHAGDDKWESLKKEKLEFLMHHKWDGKTYGIEKFTGLHRSAFVFLEEAALHVDFQLPTEHSRVGYLLDNIINQDPDLRAALASIRVNTNNMRANFDTAVAFLLPVCPYTKNKSRQRSTRRAIVSEATLKGKKDSKSGVDFRWHNAEEYSKLNKEQRKELWEWQTSKEGQANKKEYFSSRSKSGSSNKKNPTKKELWAKVSSLEKRIEEQGTSSNTSGDDDSPSLAEISAAIAAVDKKSASLKPPAKRSDPEDPYAAVAAAVQQVIKRKRT